MTITKSDAMLIGLIVAWLMLLLISGCTHAQVHYKTEKVECDASYISWKDQEGINMRACHAGGSSESSTSNIKELIELLEAYGNLKVKP